MTATRWNPSNPNVAGAEWPGAAVSIAALASLVGRGPRIVSTVTESVDTIAVPIRRTTGSGSVLFAVDVYDRANPLVDPESWAIALPAANRSNAAGWVKSLAGVESAYDANAHNNIDDVVSLTTALTVGASDQLRYQGVDPTTAPQIRFEAGSTFYDGDTGAGGATITSKRISSVEVWAVVENASAHSVRVQGQLEIGSVPYNADSGPQTISYTPVQLQLLRFSFYSNPATGKPWTHADAVALTNGTDAFGLAVITKSGAGNFIVTAMMLAFRETTERRLATGFGSSPASIDAWAPCALLAPADLTSSSWAKVNGHEYQLIYSLIRGSDVGGVSVIDTSNVYGAAIPLTGSKVSTFDLDHSGVPLDEISSVDGEMPALLYVAGTPSVDTLPYGDVTVADVGGSGSTQKQGISTHSTQSYGTAMLLVGTTQPAGGGGQDAPLVVRLKKTSDNSVLAGPVSIDPSAVPADGKYHAIRVLFPVPAALTAGTAVYLEASSTSTVAWKLPMLLSRTIGIAVDATSTAAAAAGIGGTADKAGADATADYPWSISLAPAAPGGLSRSALTFANRPALALATVPPTIGYAALDWTSTALGAAFLQYDVQRLDDGTWQDIAHIVLESSSYWNDVEAPRNVPVSYRVRVVRLDGGFSAWATFADLTIPTSSPVDVVITTAFSPADSLAFLDMSDVHEWAQLESERVVRKPIFGRDYPVVFGPAELGGEQFVRELLVADADPNIADGTIAGDRAVFDPAIALLHNRSLPYLAYCDGFGRRTLISTTAVPKADNPNGSYTITATCTQIDATTLPVEVAVPWHP